MAEHGGWQRTMLGLAVGGATGLLSATAMRRMEDAAAVRGAGAGLVAAAAIYPLARRSTSSGGIGQELAVLAGTTVLAAAADRLESSAGRRVLGWAWASHAVFDVLRGPSHDSRLPDWYPAACAGYDLALGAALVG